MDDLQKFLPFLLIGAFYIFSAVYNAKKKKESDLSKTTLPGGIPKPKVTNTNNQPKVQQVQEVKKKTATIPQVQVDYNPEVKRTVVPKESILEEEEAPAEFEFHMGDKDELKRAIIYAEILERKY